jgi:hypothetical protein
MISNLDGRIKRVNELMIESVIEPDLKEAINNLLNLIDESSNRYWLYEVLAVNYGRMTGFGSRVSKLEPSPLLG